MMQLSVETSRTQDTFIQLTENDTIEGDFLEQHFTGSSISCSIR